MSEIDNRVDDVVNGQWRPLFEHNELNKATGLRPATIDNLKILLTHRLRIIERENDMLLLVGRYKFTFKELPDLTDKATPLYLCFRSLCAEHLLPYEILDFLVLSDVVAGGDSLINFDDYKVTHEPDIIKYGGIVHG
ncbi:MAG: hypothetical protein Q8Q54_00080 [Methylococcales bacterium]|nr:hypothetical protein [Methylococcales bacterium]MDP3837301.1 hypothetical protein [Methylococcales bacterium]